MPQKKFQQTTFLKYFLIFPRKVGFAIPEIVSFGEIKGRYFQTNISFKVVLEALGVILSICLEKYVAIIDYFILLEMLYHN